jgi:transposase
MSMVESISSCKVGSSSPNSTCKSHPRHTPPVCHRCGSALAAAPVVGEERRQVFDLPVVALAVVEHRVERRACACGTITAAAFPAASTAPTCSGPGVAALGAYLLGRQHLPVERAAECLADCFGAPVSTGYLAGLLPAAADRLAEFEAVADAELAGSAVVHFDETGGRVAATLWWVHVMCTDRVTLYHLDARRGRTAMDAAGVLPGFTGVAVHDGLAAYRRYQQATHALCNAHHLRELAGIAEITGQQWPTALADLLVEAHVAVEAAKANRQTALPAPRLAAVRHRYDALVVEGQRLNPPPPRTGKRGRPKLGPAAALLARLDRHRDDVLRFASDFRVPFDNNRARRADGEAAAEDLRRLAVGVRCPGVPRGPLLPVHRPQEWPARPRCAPRPVRRPALAAGRGVQPVAALPDQPGEPRHGFTSPVGHRACGNRPTVASLGLLAHPSTDRNTRRSSPGLDRRLAALREVLREGCRELRLGFDLGMSAAGSAHQR